ncbi:AAA family ATPase [Flavobacterium ponti]|uniref:AAA family ATPase n=1 Tax=Flavobacterium ponti TaxID=665133 RepID=A0ABV9P6T7_9FLAO
MNKEIVVLIGGPSSGKTTLINKLKEHGHVCYPEVSREVIKEAQEKGIEQLFLEQPLLFSELLLEGRKKQFFSAKNEEANIVFLDRGIPDVLAYMHYIGDSYPAFFDEACKEHKYSKIFILPTWKEIYVSDDERYESYEQALLIQEHLVETYKKYGYELIEVPKDTVENRMQFLLQNLNL